MIKRLLSLFLIFLLLFLSACDENVIPPVGDDKNEEKTGTEDEYLAITPVKVGMLTPYTLALDGIAISVPLPKSWEFEEENGTLMAIAILPAEKKQELSVYTLNTVLLLLKRLLTMCKLKVQKAERIFKKNRKFSLKILKTLYMI